ncbi:MAG: hypothetical protein WD294_10450 [Phycisphaeraceae bacterium]
MSYVKTSGQRECNSVRRWGGGVLGAIALTAVVLATGCASPPSVEGLLLVAEQTLAEERQWLESDKERAAVSMAQQREGLEAAFEADLQQRETVDEEWLMRGVRVYVDARESLVRHEVQLQQEYQTRQQNLTLAGEAVQRARTMLAQQDAVFERVPDARRWLHEEHERYQQEAEQ